MNTGTRSAQTTSITRDCLISPYSKRPAITITKPAVMAIAGCGNPPGFRSGSSCCPRFCAEDDLGGTSRVMEQRDASRVPWESSDDAFFDRSHAQLRSSVGGPVRAGLTRDAVPRAVDARCAQASRCSAGSRGEAGTIRAPLVLISCHPARLQISPPMPDKTLEASADHGELRGSMATDRGDADAVVGRFAAAGIRGDALAAKLSRDSEAP
jgi:hypothetical protein